MEDINKPILDQLIHTAFAKICNLKYKITEYSLNTLFSFKFDNLDHFTEFLQQHQSVDEEEFLLLQNTLKDLNIKSDSFFYINFFEENQNKEV